MVRMYKPMVESVISVSFKSLTFVEEPWCRLQLDVYLDVKLAFSFRFVFVFRACLNEFFFLLSVPEGLVIFESFQRILRCPIDGSIPYAVLHIQRFNFFSQKLHSH